MTHTKGGEEKDNKSNNIWLTKREKKTDPEAGGGGTCL